MSMFSRFQDHVLLGTAALLLLVVPGCVNRDGVGNFRTQDPDPFSPGGDFQPPDRWWLEFNEPRLNARVNEALSGSFTLAAARQRLAAARAIARREASDFFPDVNGIADATTLFGPGETEKTSLLGLDAAYQVDVWGEIEARVDAQRLRAAATREDYHALALTLSAEIARTWFSLIEANAQASLVQEQIDTNKMGLAAQEARFGRGFVRAADVLRQRQLVESTLEQAVVAKSRIEVLEHQMAVLLGDLPQSARYFPGETLPTLAPLPATGLPSELLRRRPDVRRDYLAFKAADRDLAAAISAQFPRISLTGSVLNIADRPETVFRDWFVSIGSQLVAPLIDGGQRRAEVDRTAAVTCELFNQYGQTMLIAFQEVEDNLAREQYQVERLKHLGAQVELARQSSEQLREQYQIGDTDYLSVLTAITGQQRLQRDMLSAQLELRLIRINLYLALAGGFDVRPQDDFLFTVTELEETEEPVQNPTENVNPSFDEPELDEPDLDEPEVQDLELEMPLTNELTDDSIIAAAEMILDE